MGSAKPLAIKWGGGGGGKQTDRICSEVTATSRSPHGENKKALHAQGVRIMALRSMADRAGHPSARQKWGYS